MGEYVDVGPVEGFPVPGARVVRIAGREVGIVRWRDEIHALRNICPHASAPLCVGTLALKIAGGRPPGEMDLAPDDTPVILCPWHGWEIEIRTGHTTFDENVRVRTYAVKVVAGRVLVALR